MEQQQNKEAQSAGDEIHHLDPLTADELALQTKLVRKLDMLIMPLVFITYVMNFIDR